jgi:hypothetical protein
VDHIFMTSIPGLIIATDTTLQRTSSLSREAISRARTGTTLLPDTPSDVIPALT